MDSLGAYIRHVREQLGLSLSETARRAHVAKGYLSMLERGLQVNPSESVLRALGRVLEVDLVTYARNAAYAVQASRDVALVLRRGSDGSVIIVEMDRRAFLASAGMACAVAAVALPDRITPEVVTALSDRFDWHSTASRLHPPHVVASAVQQDFTTMLGTVRTAPSQLRPALLSQAARYATLLGWLRQEAGDTTGALYWMDRAADLSRAGRWSVMQVYTLARKTNILQHEQPTLAADLAHAARFTTRVPASVRAHLLAQEAEAQARAGNMDAARAALDAAWEIAGQVDPADRLPTPQLLKIGSQVRFQQARVELLLGHPESAITSLEPVRTEWTTPRAVAHYGPTLAHAYARAGDVDTACRLSVDVARNGDRCDSATARRELRAVREALRPWAHRSDVADVIAALPA